MKSLVIAMLFSSVSAFAADNGLNPLKISSACENRIFKSAEALCNKVSKNDESRDHDCVYWGQVSIKRNAADTAYFEADFTVTDADVYTIGVSIESKAKCEYKVVDRTQN
jgi:hypothetical protein